MREEVLQAVIDRAASDSEFEQLLRTKPGKALSSMGVTQDEWDALHNIEEAPEADALGDRSSATVKMNVVGFIATQMLGLDCGCNYTPGSRINYCYDDGTR